MTTTNMLSLDDIPIHEKCEPSNDLMKKVLIMESLVSTIDMCFESADETKTFYRHYAIRKEFGIKTRSSKKGIDN